MTLPPKLEKLLENWPAKIVSLIAAILVYAFYQISSLETRNFVIPIEVQEGAEMICTDISESSVRVAIRGNVTDVNTLETKDFKAFVDMGRYVNSGSAVLPVQLNLSDNIKIMKDIEITIQPETVEVVFEKKDSDFIPVKLNYAGGTAHGYELESIQTVPSFIKVSGPESLVAELTYIETDIILLEELTQNTVIEAELRGINEQLVSNHKGPVSVEVRVVPSKMKRVLNNLPVYLYPAAGDLITEVEKKSASVTIYGNELDIEDYSPSPNLIYVDCSSITEAGEYDLPLQTVRNGRFSIESLTPETLHVVITEKPAEEENTESEELPYGINP